MLCSLRFSNIIEYVLVGIKEKLPFFVFLLQFDFLMTDHQLISILHLICSNISASFPRKSPPSSARGLHVGRKGDHGEGKIVETVLSKMCCL